MSEVAVAGFGVRSAPLAAVDPAPRHSLTAEVLLGADAYPALLPEWQHLAQLQPGTVLFQMPSLLSVWLSHFPRRHAGLATVVLRRAGRAVLIWPLVVERRAFIRIARGAGAPISQYDEVLLDPETDARTALKTALDALATSVNPDLLLLER